MRIGLCALLCLVVVSLAAAQAVDNRFEVGAQYTNLAIGTSRSGFGGTFTYNLNRRFAIDSSVNFFPGSGTSGLFAVQELPTVPPISVKRPLLGDNITQVQAGVRYKFFRTKYAALFLKARPGLLSYSDIGSGLYFSTGFNTLQTLPGLGRRTGFSLDMGGGIEIFPSRRSFIRFDAGDAFAHFGEAELPTSAVLQPTVSQLLVSVSADRVPSANLHSYQVSATVGMRFGGQLGVGEEGESAPIRSETSSTPGKYEVGIHYTGLNLAGFSNGFGGRFTYNLSPRIAVEGAGNFFPTNNEVPYGLGGLFVGGVGPNMPVGRATQAQFGIKVTAFRFEKFAFSGKFRPGFVSFGRVYGPALLSGIGAPGPIATGPNANFLTGGFSSVVVVPFPPTTPKWERANNFSLDYGAVAEYFAGRHTTFRVEVGDTMIRGSVPIGLLGRSPRSTTNNLQIATGLGWRF